ncbi:MAG: PorP/SprF family type IX secretion system membrane protein [Psychroserpens sp.]|uniref:PorP/SprF family type IX secretion system membrane protein n=1 Tax=Psychroserpens sp. TaxID=2020870 RepID=UPI0030029072
MKLKQIIFFALILVSFSVKAQDPIFSQATFVPETLNPGFAGFEDKERIHAGLLSRLQWPGLDSRINTQYAFANQSFEGRHLNFGLGFNAQWQYETFNNYNFFQFNADYAYRLQISQHSTLRPAIEVGFGDKSNRFRNLTLGDQININSGVIDPISIDPLGNNTSSAIYFDFSTGIVFERAEIGNNDISYWIGASVKHINRPNISFVNGEKVPLDIFMSLHGNYTFPVMNDYLVSLTGNYMRQGEADRLDLGSLMHYGEFMLGITATTNPARSTPNSHLLTSINGFVGIEFTEFRFGISYDKNVSKLGNTEGVYEFSMTYLSRCRNCNTRRGRKK